MVFVYYINVYVQWSACRSAVHLAGSPGDRANSHQTSHIYTVQTFLYTLYNNNNNKNQTRRHHCGNILSECDAAIRHMKIYRMLNHPNVVRGGMKRVAPHYDINIVFMRRIDIGQNTRLSSPSSSIYTREKYIYI